MLEKGYLEQASEKQKSFRLGMKLFQTGTRYIEQTPFHDLAHATLEQLAEVAGETAFLAILNKDELVYLDKVESPNSVRTSARIGSSNPLYCTGLGKMISDAALGLSQRIGFRGSRLYADFTSH